MTAQGVAHGKITNVTANNHLLRWRSMTIIIRRELSIADLVSFAGILITGSYLLYNHLRGANVDIAPPAWIIVWAEQDDEVGPVVRLGAEATYWNSADPGFNTVIKDLYARFCFNGTMYRQEAQAVVQFDDPNEHPLCKSEPRSGLGVPTEGEKGERIFGCASEQMSKLLINKDNRLVKVLPGSSGTTHEILFKPVAGVTEIEETSLHCSKQEQYLPWSQFIGNIKQGTELKFDIGVETFDGIARYKSCLVTLSAGDIEYLKIRGWQVLDKCKSS